MPLIRLDKFLSDSGAGTRSEVKKLVKTGRVTVNGITAKDCSAKIDTCANVCVNGTEVYYSKYIYLMLNKPAGVISATKDKKDKTVIDLLRPPYSKMQLFPAGRLDKDTVGLLLITNDGDFAHSTLSPSKHISKTYYAEAEGHFTPDIASAFEEGITLDDGYVCKSASISIDTLTEDRIKAYITVTEGKYHQIKRMIEALGGKITYLKRIAFGEIKLDESLEGGEYRSLNAEELAYVSSVKESII